LTTAISNFTPAAPTGDGEGDQQHPELEPGSPAQEPGPGEDQPAAFTERPMIPVALLTTHPGNVREDKQADQAFCQSVAAAGILVPLEITTTPDGDGYVVVDGNIRLDAAIKTGLDAVPYVFSPDTADDAGLQYLHMLISSRFRRDLNVYEEASALFSASEAGMSRTQIRKATGLKAPEIRAGIAAGGLSAKTRETAEQADYEWNLEELALLSPFEDDPEAMGRILNGISYGSSVRYMVQRIADERAAEARKAQLAASLEASGITILDQVPASAVALRLLLASPSVGEGEEGSHRGHGEGDGTTGDDQEAQPEDIPELDPAGHADCPGAAAFFPAYQDDPVWYCLDPDAHGHARRYRTLASRFPAPPLPGGTVSGPDGPAENDDARRNRMLVIEGNKAWSAAGTVRQQWLTELLARKAPPSGTATSIAVFVTAQLLTMPEPLRRALGSIRHHPLYQELSGAGAAETATASLPRMWLLALAPIAASYEDQITGTGTERDTWRTDRYSPCPRTDAGAWFRFLSELGHQLSPIEQAVADGVPYRGDAPEANEPAADGGPAGNLPGIPAQTDTDDEPAAECPGPEVTGSGGEPAADSIPARHEADGACTERPAVAA